MQRMNVNLWLGLAVIVGVLGSMPQQANAGGIDVAEELLVDLRAEDLRPGPVSEWPNRGSLGGVFTAFGTPTVVDVGGWESVSLDGSSYFEGPRSVPGIEGGGTRTIEIWVYKMAPVNAEQTMVSWAHRGGPDGTNLGFNFADNPSWGAVGHWGGPDMGWGGDHAPTPAVETWWHLAYTYDGATTRLYVNGDPAGEENMTLNTHAGGIIRVGSQGDNTGENANTAMNFIGGIAQVRIHDGVLTPEQVKKNAQIRIQSNEAASSPNPEDGDTDIPRDRVLTWESGETAVTHHVYLGTSFEDVNSATVPTVSDVDVNSFDPGRLDFDQTYFWRVDEVNGTPDRTVFTGDIWSFTVEPYAIMIPVDVNKATASSSNAENTPDMTVNGSGLEGSAHSENSEAMWLSVPGDLSPWLMFEFADLQKLDQMLIWNSNSKSEVFIGWGVKDVDIEFSVDGVSWTGLAESTQISRAPGQPGYDTPQAIDLGLTLAKYVRLTILSNWGGFLKQYGVSEVQFYGLPVYAREANPASGSANVLPDASVAWRAGREADQHTVYLSTDANAVVEGSAASVSSLTNHVALDSLGVQLGETYYWRVDEVNEAQAPSVWQGDLWHFSTVPYVTVDDFERYGNYSPDRPFQTWLDGFGYSADEYFPVTYPGNGTGSGVGHDIWSPGSAYFDGDIMETARTMAGSDQSMPFYYSNTGGGASQIDRLFAASQDWTSGGAQILSIGVLGQADNTGTLYAKINNVKTLFDGDITLNIWQPWHVDLASLGINLSNVTTLSLGVDGSGASGMVLIDEIGLYRAAPEPAPTVSLVNDFDSLAVGSSMHGVPGWEGWFGDAQWGARITNTVAYSGANALEIVGTRDDVVPHWPRVESGLYVASVMQYVPSSTDGSMYFGPLSSYGATWDDTAWLGTLLSNCTSGFVYVNELDAGTRTETPLLRDQWVQLKIVMNFDADTCDFYYGDVLLGTLACPSAMGFDIWPDDDVDVIYYDDFSFESM
ncbi:MAG: discoidin domain-containing protein [Phycisphaerae bacterium]|nr:discoidin domain-containing protein [Phycisphaerae bacterium]